MLHVYVTYSDADIQTPTHGGVQATKEAGRLACANSSSTHTHGAKDCAAWGPAVSPQAAQPAHITPHRKPAKPEQRNCPGVLLVQQVVV